MSRPGPRAVTVAAAIPVLLTACRDAVDPFVPGDQVAAAQGSSWRLTFSVESDRAPAWSASGESIFYHRPGSDPLPPDLGVVVAIPFRGGALRVALPGVQREAGTRRWLVAAAPAPDGERVVFAEMSPFEDVDACGNLPAACDAGPWIRTVPMIRTVAFRVRRMGAGGPVSEDPALKVPFVGRSFDETDRPEGLPGTHVAEMHPFHFVERDEDVLFFRPSWSPEGDRIVYSDGLALHRWRPGAGDPVEIPGTDDGVSPAWGPDGSWIAFSRLERLPPERTACIARVEGIAVCSKRQTVWRVGRRTLTLVRPDGGETRALGPGEEPAWSPDGAALYYRREGAIWRIGVDGTSPEPVPGTGGGREPAVSPDGRWLTFARSMPDGQHDLFVTRIGGGS